MAGHAEDRYYSDARRRPARHARHPARHAPLPRESSLTDEWLDLGVGLRWSLPGGLWCFPIETVSQSEGGFEGVYQ